MTRSAFAQSLRRPEPAKPQAESYCRAGMPARGDVRPAKLCPDRTKCAQHGRYVALLESGKDPHPRARIMGRPYVDGCQCHYKEPA